MTKSFEDNPALWFISDAPQNSADTGTVVQPKKTKNERGTVTKPLYAETRSKRVNMLMQPSLYEKLRDMAKNCGVSTNDLMNQALEKFLENKSKEN
jgi:hypothetical protein